MGIPSWLIGVALSLGGCTLSNFGVNLQKLTHMKIAQGADKERSVVSHPVWIIGMATVITGSICDLVSFGFADMSLLAPLGAMTLVINMFIAPCFLQETLTKRDILSTVVILAGTVLSIAFGNKSSQSYNLDELEALYEKPAFIIYSCIAVAGVIAIVITVKKVSKKVENETANASDRRFMKVVYPTMAGFTGAHSVLFAKSSAEIVKQAFREGYPWGNPIAYFFLISLIFFLFWQMKLLNIGLEKADALLVVPLYQVSWVIMNTIVSMVYFRDYKSMHWYQMLIFVAGVLVTIAGVYMLSQRKSTVRDTGDSRVRAMSTATPLYGFNTILDDSDLDIEHLALTPDGRPLQFASGIMPRVLRSPKGARKKASINGGDGIRPLRYLPPEVTPPSSPHHMAAEQEDTLVLIDSSRSSSSSHRDTFYLRLHEAANNKTDDNRNDNNNHNNNDHNNSNHNSNNHNSNNDKAGSPNSPGFYDKGASGRLHLGSSFESDSFSSILSDDHSTTSTGLGASTEHDEASSAESGTSTESSINIISVNDEMMMVDNVDERVHVDDDDVQEEDLLVSSHTLLSDTVQ